MKTAITILVSLLLSGCAGLTTMWRFQMDMGYVTPQDKPTPPPVASGKPS